ncbi:DMT family transporter [Candidatus Protochlamydia sp. R18]|uniref:DMT family transporter n=1 Tax=Candidatus Protochlamydia sp. R18 TaxID=1353977 RepID=UPI0005A6DE65|nr:DMT family transporter [Candidatus Protochlamydia sp. R18]
MYKGIVLVLSACLLWGLIFVIPDLLISFTPLEVALGRYFCFGFISFIIMLCQGINKWLAIPKMIWIQALIYALVVNIFYYFSLILGSRYSNASTITLLLSLSPITLALYGNWHHQECSFKQLILPSLIVIVGLVLVNYSAINNLCTTSCHTYLFGLSCGIFSLFSWNWYVLSNAKFLKQHPEIPPSDWATLLGLATLFWVLLIISFSLIVIEKKSLNKFFVFDRPLQEFLIGSCILGFFCSWIGAYLWNKGSQEIPMTLAGQLTIFETIFGLIYVYSFHRRFPTVWEGVGMIILLWGTFFTLQTFKKGQLIAPTH